MRAILALILCLASAGAQSFAVADASCPSAANLQCSFSAPRPGGRDWYFQVSGLSPGDWCFLVFDWNAGSGNCPVPLPFDLGPFNSSLAGCLLMTWGEGCTMGRAATGASWVTWGPYRLRYNWPQIVFQALTPWAGPAGWSLTTEAIVVSP